MKKKILVVDDMQQWIKFHTSALYAFYKEADFELEITSKLSAREAYEEVSNNLDSPYDLVLTDLQMELDFEPEHAGEWLAKNIKLLKQYQNTPLILVSASYDIKFIAQKLNVDFLPKNSIVHNPLNYKLKLQEVLGR